MPGLRYRLLIGLRTNFIVFNCQVVERVLIFANPVLKKNRYKYVQIYENGVKEFAPYTGVFSSKGDDIIIERKVSLFFLHSFIFLLLLSLPYFNPFIWLGGCL